MDDHFIKTVASILYHSLGPVSIQKGCLDILAELLYISTHILLVVFFTHDEEMERIIKEATTGCFIAERLKLNTFDVVDVIKKEYPLNDALIDYAKKYSAIEQIGLGPVLPESIPSMTIDEKHLPPLPASYTYKRTTVTTF